MSYYCCYFAYLLITPKTRSKATRYAYQLGAIRFLSISLRKSCLDLFFVWPRLESWCSLVVGVGSLPCAYFLIRMEDMTLVTLVILSVTCAIFHLFIVIWTCFFFLSGPRAFLFVDHLIFVLQGKLYKDPKDEQTNKIFSPNFTRKHFMSYCNRIINNSFYRKQEIFVGNDVPRGIMILGNDVPFLKWDLN